MKTILCFGDSNTWGYNPENRQRFGPEERWTGILRNSLGEDYRVIEEGLNGRTPYGMIRSRDSKTDWTT